MKLFACHRTGPNELWRIDLNLERTEVQLSYINTETGEAEQQVRGWCSCEGPFNGHPEGTFTRRSAGPIMAMVKDLQEQIAQLEAN